MDLATLLRRRRADLAFRPGPVGRLRLDAVLDAGRFLPLPGPAPCHAVLLEEAPVREALLASLEAGHLDARFVQGLRGAPALIVLCDMSGGGPGRPAALLAAAQMALAAEEEGLAAAVVPVGGAGVPPDLPLPEGGRVEAIVAVGPAGSSPAPRPDPAGVGTYLAAPSPPRLASSGDGDRDALVAFMEIASATADAEDLDEILRTIARALGRLFPVDGAALGLLDEGAVVVREILRRGEAVRREPDRLANDGSHVMSFVLGSGRPLLRNDVPSEVRFKESLPQAGMRSDMTIPLRARGRIIGALAVASRRRHAYGTEDFRMLQKCADLTTVAVETQRLLLRTKKLAELDGLTGICNHRHFIALLDQEVEAARRADRPLGLLMIDIDDFKRVNDTHGHQAGDEVLHHVAQLAARALRRTDVVARYGGEEFAAILPDSTLEGALKAAESIRAETERSPLAHPTIPSPLYVKVSVGVASLPEDALTGSDLVAAADRGLYVAKRSGKNRVCHVPG